MGNQRGSLLMHKYILEKDGCYLTSVGMDLEGNLQFQITPDREGALSLHFKKTIKQLRSSIKKYTKVKFNIIKV